MTVQGFVLALRVMHLRQWVGEMLCELQEKKCYCCPTESPVWWKPHHPLSSRSQPPHLPFPSQHLPHPCFSHSPILDKVGNSGKLSVPKATTR